MAVDAIDGAAEKSCATSVHQDFTKKKVRVKVLQLTRTTPSEKLRSQLQMQPPLKRSDLEPPKLNWGPVRKSYFWTS